MVVSELDMKEDASPSRENARKTRLPRVTTDVLKWWVWRTVHAPPRLPPFRTWLAGSRAWNATSRQFCVLEFLHFLTVHLLQASSHAFREFGT